MRRPSSRSRPCRVSVGPWPNASRRRWRRDGQTCGRDPSDSKDRTRRRRPGADGITPPPTASGGLSCSIPPVCAERPHPHRPHRRPVPPHRLLPELRTPDPTSPDGAWRTIETKLGLDLEGGLRVEYQALPKDGVQPTREALNVIKDIIERRVNTTGVSEPVVVVQGDDRVVIELPGISDVDSVRRLVGQTGKLDFVPLGQTQATDGRSSTWSSTRRCSAAISSSPRRSVRTRRRAA